MQWWGRIIAHTLQMTFENRFPHHQPLWGEPTRHQWIPLTEGQQYGALMFPLSANLNKLLNEQPSDLWNETPKRTYDVTIKFSIGPVLCDACRRPGIDHGSSKQTADTWETRDTASQRISRVFNTLRPRQIGRHFSSDIFKWIFLNEYAWISSKISLKIVAWGPINNILALVQTMAWRRPGDKPLSEPMIVSLMTHICFTQPQWVKIPRSRIDPRAAGFDQCNISYMTTSWHGNGFRITSPL